MGIKEVTWKGAKVNIHFVLFFLQKSQFVSILFHQFIFKFFILTSLKTGCIFQPVVLSISFSHPGDSCVTNCPWPFLLRSRKLQLQKLLKLIYELNSSNFIKTVILTIIFEEFSYFKHVNGKQCILC